jgi:hypothetical protein
MMNVSIVDGRPMKRWRCVIKIPYSIAQVTHQKYEVKKKIP